MDCARCAQRYKDKRRTSRRARTLHIILTWQRVRLHSVTAILFLQPSPTSDLPADRHYCCLAWRASKAGARVALYDAGSSQGEGSAAWAAAGMIAPTAEAVDGSAQIASMGRHSLALWPLWLAELPIQVFYRTAEPSCFGTARTRGKLSAPRDCWPPGTRFQASSASALLELRTGNPLSGHDFREPCILPTTRRWTIAHS